MAGLGLPADAATSINTASTMSVAVSGLLIHRFAENLTAAMHPKAAAKLELR
jgi:hypothetical protein